MDPARMSCDGFLFGGGQSPPAAERRGRGARHGPAQRLIELREMIKVESLRLPTARQRDLLGLLERSRPWKTAPSLVPEMSRGELIRAIRWRLGPNPPLCARGSAG